MSSRSLHLVPCVRPAVAPTEDEFGNHFGTNRPEETFDAAFAPPVTQAGSRIIDGVLRETTITKPMLYHVTGNPDIKSGDPIVIDGEDGWQVDGKPGKFVNPFTGHVWPLAIQLRRTDG